MLKSRILKPQSEHSSLSLVTLAMEQFWWDYLKLNIFLSDLEYKFGYYVLMNRWQVPVIQKWIAEYHEKGYFESQRAKDYLLFYLKASEKAPVRVLNSMGVQVKVKMTPR